MNFIWSEFYFLNFFFNLTIQSEEYLLSEKFLKFIFNFFLKL